VKRALPAAALMLLGACGAPGGPDPNLRPLPKREQ